jgi:hypothetical protein
MTQSNQPEPSWLRFHRAWSSGCWGQEGVGVRDLMKAADDSGISPRYRPKEGRSSQQQDTRHHHRVPERLRRLPVTSDPVTQQHHCRCEEQYPPDASPAVHSKHGGECLA